MKECLALRGGLTSSTTFADPFACPISLPIFSDIPPYGTYGMVAFQYAAEFKILDTKLLVDWLCSIGPYISSSTSLSLLWRAGSGSTVICAFPELMLRSLPSYMLYMGLVVASEVYSPLLTAFRSFHLVGRLPLLFSQLSVPLYYLIGYLKWLHYRLPCHLTPLSRFYPPCLLFLFWSRSVLDVRCRLSPALDYFGASASSV